MLTVSLLIEILRTRPRLVFWLAALSQALLWLLVPSLFYSAPPGDLADVLAVGRELKFGGELGPPLAYWLAEIALRAAGGHMFGVYLLSQVCIVVTYWAVFRLGSAIVGERHAVLAVFLMIGISVFTIGSPDFGPDNLMMPLWALAILHLWRAAGESKGLYWLALAADLSLMLLTSFLALPLIAALIVFLLIHPRGRASLMHVGAGAAALILALMLLPTYALIVQHGFNIGATFAHLRGALAVDQNLMAWGRLIALVLVAHAGAGILVVLAGNLARTRRSEAAAVTRAPIDPFARFMIYYFALVPVIVVTAFTVISGKSGIGGIPPLLVLSGLAIVTAAGDTIMLHHQRILSIAWFSLLVLPPALAAAATLVLPSMFAVDLKVAQPADEMGRFFTENFERRTGSKLEVVAGDPRLAAVIALASPSRPQILNEEKPGRPRLASRQAAFEKGAIVVWRATDATRTLPPQIKEQFPDLVAEVPRAFERGLQGRAPLLRVGWGMIRPQAQTPAASALPTAPQAQ